MGMKFLNKKGWHTGSLRNIENVWKAEQKHDAEQKKLEELRKQLHEERERSEFRLLQEQAGLLPKQERLDFLYESGLAVGKASASDGFKALEAPPKSGDAPPSSSASAPSKDLAAAVPGALFEEKPHSANDSWRKLHSDPLLMIRQREQEALARVKNNPVQMAMIRKSVEVKQKKRKKKSHKDKEHRKKGDHSSSKHQKDSSSSSGEEERKASRRKSSNHDNKYLDSEDESPRKGRRGEGNSHRSSKYREQSPSDQSDRETVRLRRETRSANNEKFEKENHRSSKHRDLSPGDRLERDRRDDRSNDRVVKENYRSSRHKERSPIRPLDRETERDRRDSRSNDKSEKESYQSSKKDRERSPGFQSDRATTRDRRDVHDNDQTEKENRRSSKHRERSPEGQVSRETERGRRDARREDRDEPAKDSTSMRDDRHEAHRYKRHGAAPKLSKEERAAKLREMQMDAEVHEDQRWKRLKKADEEDAQEASRAATTGGKNFLDAAQKSIFGTEKGGSTSIAESVRRRTHYSQGRSESGNAFRR